MNPSRVALAAAALVAASLSACSSSQETSPATCSPDLESIRAQIFTGSCTASGCHGATTPAAGLDLTTEDVASQLVGVAAATCDGKTRVVGGHPEQSFLYEKLTAANPTCGAHMPQGGDLTAEQKACVAGSIAGLSPSDGGGGGDAGCEACGGTACVDLTSDPAHCGSCALACPAGAACAGAACACSGGLTACDGSCVDTASDAASCGACGKACPVGALCQAAQCTCPNGGAVCADACVDLASDPTSCGACGNACAANEVCNQGACSAGCGALTQCGASCVDTETSASHCGGCGNACSLGGSCVGGTCQCPVGTSDCNGQCVATATDPSNCGGCGETCAQGTTCTASVCGCPGGGQLCGAGCIDTQTDPSNCGGCGASCALGQTCSAGVCTCGNASVSFSGAVQPIFTASCANAGCHTGVMPQAGMNLSQGKAYAALVDVAASECNDARKRVLPGKPSESYLIDKLMGVDLCSGTQMPKSGTIAQAKIETVANWICAGAPDN